MEPLYKGYVGTIILVLITEVSSIQRSFNTLQYYTGTQNGVLIIEASTFQRFVIEWFQCMSYVCITHYTYICKLFSTPYFMQLLFIRTYLHMYVLNVIVVSLFRE